MKHFRVDKMDNIRVDYEKREGKEAFKALKLTDRSLKVFSMFGGTEENVTMHFSNHLTGVVIDRFGRDVMLLPVDEHHFSVSVKVEVSPQFFGWVCGLGEGVRIVSPAAVVEQMGEYVKEIANMY